jgi:hypothetical protein
MGWEKKTGSCRRATRARGLSEPSAPYCLPVNGSVDRFDSPRHFTETLRTWVERRDGPS